MHIAIEGNIGVGKTTLARMLAKSLNARLVLEDFSDNPFLPSFYENPEKFAFPLEMSFMAQRFLQWREAMDSDLFQPIVVSDYHFDKSLLFASHTLSSDVYPMFRKLSLQLSSSLRKPDVLIFLRSPVDRLLEKIDERGREYEKGITSDYLLKVEEVYHNWLNHQRDVGVLHLTIRKKYITEQLSVIELIDLIHSVFDSKEVQKI